MTSILIGVLTFFLLLISFFMVAVILLQPSKGGGLGSAMGGGFAEGALGTDSANVLSRWTIYLVVGFFVIAFALYMLNLSEARKVTTNATLPTLSSLEPAAAEATPLIETEAALPAELPAQTQ